MKLSVIVLITYLIAFVVITGVAYFILERRRIKKALEDPAAARHSSLPAPDTTARTVAFIVLFFMFWSISSSVNNMSDNITGAMSNVANSIIRYNNGAEEIENAIKGQQSNLAYFSDRENDSGGIEISVIPKQVSESASVTVYLGDESVTLTKGQGAEFTGAFKVNAYDYEGAVYIVCVETDGVIYSESVESLMW